MTGIDVINDDVVELRVVGIASTISKIDWGRIFGNINDQEDLQEALNAKANASALVSHINDTDNPHQVSKSQVGLGNVDNTSDQEKPISDAVQNALNNKANNSDIPTELSQLNNDKGFIDKDVNNLTNYTKSTGVGSKLQVSIDGTTYVMTLTLTNEQGTPLSTDSVDLPLETMVVSATYDNVNKKIVLTLQSGQNVDVPVGDLVSGLQTEITNQNKLASDLVDDTNQSNKFVTAEEKQAWNDLSNVFSIKNGKLYCKYTKEVI